MRIYTLLQVEYFTPLKFTFGVLNCDAATHLVFACQTELIPKTILNNMLSMCLGQLLNGLVDDLNATILSHALGGVVGVRSSACTTMIFTYKQQVSKSRKRITKTLQISKNAQLNTAGKSRSQI